MTGRGKHPSRAPSKYELALELLSYARIHRRYQPLKRLRGSAYPLQ